MAEPDSGTEGKEGKDPNEVAARGALLQFFSERAVSFGGLFVASIFGTVTLLAVVQGISWRNNIELIIIVLSVLPYIGFAGAGYYTFGRFAEYSGIADKIRISLEKDANLAGQDAKGWLRQSEIKDVSKLSPELQSRIKKDGEFWVMSIRELVAVRYEQRQQWWVKKLLEKLFPFLYWGIMIVMGVLVYIPSLF